MSPKRPMVFISNMTGSPWGGSEELWAGAASQLARDGFAVRASVHGWSPPHARIGKLREDGVDVHLRKTPHSLLRRAWKKAVACNKTPIELEMSTFLTADSPALIVLSDAASTPPIGALQECNARAVPFVTISQSNSEHFWPEDQIAEKYRKLMPAARRCYFVSRANLKLFEKQIGCELPNAEIVYNPFNIRNNSGLPWPPMDDACSLRLACVARLHPSSKGQDLLLEALAASVWRSRNWRLTLYGEGPMQGTIGLMIQRLGLMDKVKMAGFVSSIEKVWAENHVLVMPSRYEGLPLSMVEAMLCARPVVATDVAGHSEILQDGLTGFLADAPTTKSISQALERLWTNRTGLEAMGRAAAHHIRNYVPPDPARAFADKLKAIAAAV